MYLKALNSDLKCNTQLTTTSFQKTINNNAQQENSKISMTDDRLIKIFEHAIRNRQSVEGECTVFENNFTSLVSLIKEKQTNGLVSSSTKEDDECSLEEKHFNAIKSLIKKKQTNGLVSSPTKEDDECTLLENKLYAMILWSKAKKMNDLEAKTKEDEILKRFYEMLIAYKNNQLPSGQDQISDGVKETEEISVGVQKIEEISDDVQKIEEISVGVEEKDKFLTCPNIEETLPRVDVQKPVTVFNFQNLWVEEEYLFQLLSHISLFILVNAFIYRDRVIKLLFLIEVLFLIIIIGLTFGKSLLFYIAGNIVYSLILLAVAACEAVLGLSLVILRTRILSQNLNYLDEFAYFFKKKKL